MNKTQEDYLKEHAVERKRQQLYIKNHPNRKERIIVHGGCISCTTPMVEGLRVCLNCQYYGPDWSKPDLSKDLTDSEKKRIIREKKLERILK